MQLMVECLLSMHKALGLISSTSTTKQKSHRELQFRFLFSIYYAKLQCIKTNNQQIPKL
jgi:hypothetical protein